MEAQKEFEIDREFERLGITPFQATEFDQSLNDATRHDINRFVDEYGDDIMGISLWDFKLMRGEELRDALTSSVSYLFKADDLGRVISAIHAYKKNKDTIAFLNAIEAISIYCCFWV